MSACAANVVAFPAPTESRSLISVREAATRLGVSECWVRRHVRELPSVRVGRLIRFDLALLVRQFHGTSDGGNRLEPEGITLMVKRKQKRYQQGSIVRRGKRGQQVWYGVFREDVPIPDGGFRRRQRFVRLGSVEELPNRGVAYGRLAQVMGRKPTAKMTLLELFERWEKVIAQTHKGSTEDKYLFELRSYILPAFGSSQVSEITRYDVESFLADKAKSYAKSTLKGMKVALSKLLSWAVENEWIEKNACDGVKLPEGNGRRVKRVILKAEQLKKLVAALPEPYATFALFLAVTGLRPGEAIGLKWSDFEGNVLHIQRRIYERAVDTPKTKNSDRYIPIPSALLARLKALGEDGEWVFRSEAGTPIDPHNSLIRYLHPTALRVLGLRLGGWQDFRHMVATRLRGHNQKIVSEVLGNSVKTMLDVYQHVETEDLVEPMNERALELLGPAKPEVVSKTLANAPLAASGFIN